VGRERTQVVEVDLHSGITTNDTLVSIGGLRPPGPSGVPMVGLYQSQNALWNYRYPRVIGSAPGPWALRQPLAFPNRTPTSFTGMKSMRDIGFTFNTDPVFDKYVALIGCNTSNQYAMWGDLGGAEVAFGGAVGRSTLSAGKSLGCSVRWLNPGKDPASGSPSSDAVLVFSHPELSRVYYLFDAGSTIESLTGDVTNCPAGAAALAVHLDRLWLLKEGFLWYTDPLNIDSIRTTNVIRTLGTGTCLVPGQFGDIDTSGVPHLIIASYNSIQVLDGDPQLGGGLQADLRTLSTQTGVLSSHGAAITPIGTFLLTSDGDLKFIPLGCQSIESVGGPIRDRLGINNKTFSQEADGGATQGSIVWMDPYLYIFPGGETAHFYVAEPTLRGITFWGPMIGVSDYATAGREAVIRAPTLDLGRHAPSGYPVPSLHSVDMAPVTGVTARYLALDTRSAATGSYPDGTHSGRAGALMTGTIGIPGHRVQVNRVILESLRVPALSGGGNPSWTVGVTGDDGTNVTADPTPESNTPPVGTYVPGVTHTMHFAPRKLSANRNVRVTIVSTTEANPALQRAFLELHITPAQF
jgi:hypothetical protein